MDPAQAERDAIAALLDEMAAEQEHYSSDAYTQHTDAQRKGFQHGAYILREAADRARRERHHDGT